MFWVHCNSCFIKPGNKRPFFITSCNHIYCDQCISEDEQVCQRCRVKCKIIKFNSQMPNDVKALFSDLSTQVNVILKALDFQNTHRNKLLAYFRSIAQKYQLAKLAVKDLETKFRLLEHKYQMAKAAIKDREEKIFLLKRELEKYNGIPSSPFKPPTSSKGSTFSHLNFQQGTPGGSSCNLSGAFTPLSKTGHMRCMNKSPSTFYTPESVGSRRSSEGSAHQFPVGPSRGSAVPRMGGFNSAFTPPSNSLQLLSIVPRQ